MKGCGVGVGQLCLLLLLPCLQLSLGSSSVRAQTPPDANVCAGAEPLGSSSGLANLNNLTALAAAGGNVLRSTNGTLDGVLWFALNTTGLCPAGVPVVVRTCSALTAPVYELALFGAVGPAAASAASACAEAERLLGGPNGASAAATDDGAAAREHVLRRLVHESSPRSCELRGAQRDGEDSVALLPAWLAAVGADPERLLLRAVAGGGSSSDDEAAAAAAAADADADADAAAAAGRRRRGGGPQLPNPGQPVEFTVGCLNDEGRPLPPANDDCAAPQRVAAADIAVAPADIPVVPPASPAVPQRANFESATSKAASYCAAFEQDFRQRGPNLYYSFQAPCTGAMHFVSFDSTRLVYTLMTEAQASASNCGSPGVGGNAPGSPQLARCGEDGITRLPVVQGTEYILDVAVESGRRENASFELTCVPAIGNDECTDSPLVLEPRLGVHTITANTGTDARRTAWFSWTFNASLPACANDALVLKACITGEDISRVQVLLPEDADGSGTATCDSRRWAYADGQRFCASGNNADENQAFLRLKPGATILLAVEDERFFFSGALTPVWDAGISIECMDRTSPAPSNNSHCTTATPVAFNNLTTGEVPYSLVNQPTLGMLYRFFSAIDYEDFIDDDRSWVSNAVFHSVTSPCNGVLRYRHVSRTGAATGSTRQWFVLDGSAAADIHCGANDKITGATSPTFIARGDSSGTQQGSWPALVGEQFFVVHHNDENRHLREGTFEVTCEPAASTGTCAAPKPLAATAQDPLTGRTVFNVSALGVAGTIKAELTSFCTHGWMASSCGVATRADRVFWYPTQEDCDAENTRLGVFDQTSCPQSISNTLFVHSTLGQTELLGLDTNALNLEASVVVECIPEAPRPGTSGCASAVPMNWGVTTPFNNSFAQNTQVDGYIEHHQFFTLVPPAECAFGTDITFELLAGQEAAVSLALVDPTLANCTSLDVRTADNLLGTDYLFLGLGGRPTSGGFRASASDASSGKNYLVSIGTYNFNDYAAGDITISYSCFVPVSTTGTTDTTTGLGTTGAATATPTATTGGRAADLDETSGGADLTSSPFFIVAMVMFLVGGLLVIAAAAVFFADQRSQKDGWENQSNSSTSSSEGFSMGVDDANTYDQS